MHIKRTVLDHALKRLTSRGKNMNRRAACLTVGSDFGATCLIVRSKRLVRPSSNCLGTHPSTAALLTSPSTDWFLYICHDQLHRRHQHLHVCIMSKFNTVMICKGITKYCIFQLSDPKLVWPCVCTGESGEGHSCCRPLIRQT